MKQLKKPSRAQKKFISQSKLNPDNWFIERDSSTEMVLVHRHTSTLKRIRKTG
ncbi:DUF6906 family protein [Paenibacillus sp. S-38]|uniref:DUF6906 family protein n=1 Tax=Paenibacillus sp. S-38 TaxID=3416710 RepID=UPI003CF0727E